MKEETTKKVRTPRNADSILSGVKKLPLTEKVAILKELQKDIAEEVTKLQDAAKAAAELVK